MFRSRYFGARYWLARFFGGGSSSGGDVSIVPRPRERRAATVSLTGVEFSLSAGALRATVGVSSTLRGAALSLETGRLDAEGIQNPTAEEIAALLALDAVSGP